jgi:hypothetical protein
MAVAPDSSGLRMDSPQEPPVRWWSIVQPRQPSEIPVQKRYPTRYDG